MVKKFLFLNTVKENITNFKKQSFLGKCDIVSFVLLFLFFVDCAFSGGGKYLQIGPVSFRMIVAGAAFIFAIPKLITNIKKYIRNPLLYMFSAFLVYLAFSAVVGIKANNNMGVLLSDLKGFMWLFTVPSLIITVDSKKRFEYILNAIVLGAFIQATMVLTIHFVSCIFKNGFWLFYETLIEQQFGILDLISYRIFRIFMRSSPYMILACSIIFFKQLKQDKLKIKYILSIALFLVCILLSFTRSLFGGVSVVFVCIIFAVVIFYRFKIKLMIKTLFCVALSVLLCVGVMEFVFDAAYLNFAISRTFGVPVKQSIIVSTKYKIKNIDWKSVLGLVGSSDSGDSDTEDEYPYEFDTEDEYPYEFDIESQQNYINNTEASDSLRAITKRELKALIIKKPIFGNGLGACSETRGGADEYFYYDMLARMGIIGLLLYMAPFIYICFYILKKKQLAISSYASVALICGVIGFWAVTWYNPWMNAALGIAVYSLSCSTIEVYKNKN